MEHFIPWFRLINVPGIGNHIFKRLIDRFGEPEKAFCASDASLLGVEGVTPRLIAAIRASRLEDRAREDCTMALSNGCAILTLNDPLYPPLLRQIPDPPPFLYVLGRLENSVRNIALVGSRNATSYGLSTTRRLSADLAALGITVVSGMARGIDTAAHEGALMGGGKTIAVLGSGLGKIYPSENRKLFDRIVAQGAAISEFPFMTGPEPHNFPVRNRIISGIALGTVIVEATKNSGSLITARLAAEQGREVFAVPGSVQSFKSSGTHGLIKQGAKLVEHARDIVEEILPLLSEAPGESGTTGKEDSAPILSAAEATVIAALDPYPVHIDDLVRKLSMEPGKLSGVLLQLELRGLVLQSPGKRFSIPVEK